MFDFLTYYALTLLSAAVTAAMSIIMLMLHVPRTPEWCGFRMLRAFLAFTYLLLSAANVGRCMVQQEAEDPDLLSSVTLFTAAYQALLFTAATLVFMHSSRIMGKVVSHAVVIAVAGTALLLSKAFLHGLFPLFFWLATAAYTIQISYYTYLFRKEHKRCVRRLEEFYDDAMYGRLRWVSRCFYGALAVGLFALLVVVFPKPIEFYDTFIVFFTVYYVYMCCCVVNYRVNAGFIVRMAAARAERREAEETVAEPGAVEQETLLDDGKELDEEKEMSLRQSLQVWVDRKGFVEKDATLEDIAKELGTSQRLLSAHFSKYAQTPFRTWRTKLRIDEACRLLREESDLQLKSLNDQVGIGDYSYFYKQFKQITGMSPRDYREQYFGNSGEELAMGDAS